MLGIYARTFITAARMNQPKVRSVEKQPRRWNPAGHWIDPPKEF
ncbi:hypothetical protein GCM10011360_31820 [Primorskyibacter flagellatus]|uniref:Uncharacterized protein n=1 Tax=Primorskyibacter flagellatus TaxID=1387277 RepID=A0A917EIW8_9RHOB|nr:hypothetical protein [Primorskyibacter flagellatus]GGE42032.1 hypothetical protein GCM10011360_31820 [Primorskyibacter flagellatus]